MSENKKYFYLKFKENYFEQDHIKVIEAMDNGYIYSLILLKLYLKSLKFEGQLRINEYIPYKADKIDILAKVINHDSDHVMHAINLAKDLGIIEIMKTGEIFIADIQNFIGHSSTENDRKIAYRKRLKSSNSKQLTKRDKNGTNDGTNLDEHPPDLELDLELNLKKELELDKNKKESSLYNSLKEYYTNNLITNDNLSKESISNIIFKVKKERENLANLLKRFNSLKDFEYFIWQARHDKWIVETARSFLPSILNSQYSRLMEKVEKDKI